MCGICGIVGFEDKVLLRRMCDVISHRGPDDSGYYSDKNIELGSRRLSIIDVKGGHQPIHNEDETIWIVFNGEIYNFLKLKELLEENGHKFYTNCDTEVIVHAYEDYGEKCVKLLKGMFAFAIWDSKKKKLLLARDRVGKKPLYYASKNSSFLFGSEIKSMLQYEKIERKVDYEALHNFLTFRYVPGPLTMFKNIKKLQPGYILTYQNNKIRVRKYWDVKFGVINESENYYIKNILRLLRNSVKTRLMSEVPLGAYLSGGIDSSSVVGIMSEFMEEPVKTFTVGFGDEKFDENIYARIVSEKFGTDHHEFIVKPSKINILPKIVWHFDEPVADPAAIPVYLISELAKKYVTVVLTGEGGDEVFAGYEQCKIISNANRYIKYFPETLKDKIIPYILRTLPKNIFDSFFAYSSSLGEMGISRAVKFIKYLDDVDESYLVLTSIFDEDEKKNLYSDETKIRVRDLDSIKVIRPYIKSVNSNILNKILLFEIKVQLPDNLLMKADKMIMAHSIEARVPLLDQEFIEFSNTIPPDLKLRGFNEKYIFRKAMKEIVPEIITKRNKQRFFVPIHSWFEDELKDVSENLFSEEQAVFKKYFNYHAIKNIKINFEKSKLYYSRQLWNILNFIIWHKIFIEDNNLYKPKLKGII